VTARQPYYRFRMELPSRHVGHAMSDLQVRCAEFEVESATEDITVICGRAPASKLHGYTRELIAYTHGEGRLFCTSDGFEPCPEPDTIVAEAQYDPEADIENPPHSVFCAHGAGFTVPWNEVEHYKHLDAGINLSAAEQSLLPRPARLAKQYNLSDEELEAIMLREFGPIKRRRYSEPRVQSAQKSKHTPHHKASKLHRKLMIVDGYNLIYAWENLKEIADFSLEKARETLMDILSNYVAYTKTEVVLVFDAYRVKEGIGSDFTHDGYRVVYTKENQTADAFIEKMMFELGPDYDVRVVTGDRLLQFSAVHSGILRTTAKEFLAEVTLIGNEIESFIRKLAEE